MDVELALVGAQAHARTMAEIHQEAATAAYAHIFDSPFPFQEVRARWSAHTGRVYLALRAGAAIGFAAAAEDGTLEALYVLPEEGGAGVGTALLQAIAPVSRLWVLEANVAGRAFYERRGWRWSGIRQQAANAEGVPELMYISVEPATEDLDPPIR
jgi:GNAT superfamily N-acetyltransferase